MELWEKIRAGSLGTCDRWSSWISCPSLCDSSCCGHFVCSNSTMEVGRERNLCFPRRFGSKITSQCCPMWGDLSWWQIEMLIKERRKVSESPLSHRLLWSKMQNRWGCKEPSKALFFEHVLKNLSQMETRPESLQAKTLRNLQGYWNLISLFY